ncbi:MAG TPA: DUF1638 domain-containing protein [Actinomycetes bacterium]|nr:DUF1638 domain-containing protein [Actinomycetes bacterium]
MTTTASPSVMTTKRGTIAVIACGAIASDVALVAKRKAWPIDVLPLPPLLHNHPERIAAAVERALDESAGQYSRFAVAYADCGSYGALDELCQRRGLVRLGGAHCYDVYAGTARLQRLLSDEPGTYVLTDFLAASFHRSVVVELGLDRHPELRDDYFGNYRRVVWLAQRRTTELETAARLAASTIGLPLEVVDVGLEGLEQELVQLVEGTR